jgi:hypothetical protein
MPRPVVTVCGGCSTPYEKFRAGFTFTDARHAIRYSVNRAGEERKFFTRHGVLGLMHAWKLDAWESHLNECSYARLDVSDRTWRVERCHHRLVLDADDRFCLGVEAGDEVTVDIDGIEYIGALDDDRVVMRASWRELRDELPATRVVLRNQRLLDARAAALVEDVPF